MTSNQAEVLALFLFMLIYSYLSETRVVVCCFRLNRAFTRGNQMPVPFRMTHAGHRGNSFFSLISEVKIYYGPNGK